MNKKGSYIVEAALTLPVFILCVLGLAFVVNIISLSESVGYYTSLKIHQIDENAGLNPTGAGVKTGIEKEIRENDPRISDFAVTGLRYLYSSGGNDNLIALETRTRFTVSNAIGINGRIELREKLLTRGFTGKKLSEETLSVSDFQSGQPSEIVMVFPLYGKRFHKETCRYNEHYYGQNSSRITMEKEDALRKGYSPCLVCGG